jgi:hypothetical protein
MVERRIINKMKQPEVDVNTENITVKVPTIEERIAGIEAYIGSADPYIRSIVEIQEIKKQLALFNDEITRIAGVQSRANSYLDGKLAQIDQTLEAIVTIVKKHDEDYKELMSDVDPDITDLYEDETEVTPTPAPEVK